MLCHIVLLSVTLGPLGQRDAVLDLGPLTPAIPPGPAYKVTITFVALDGAKLKLPVAMGGTAGPEDVIGIATLAMRDTGWQFRVDGDKLFVSGRGNVPLASATVVSTGPHPILTWERRSRKKKRGTRNKRVRRNRLTLVGAQPHDGHGPPAGRTGSSSFRPFGGFTCSRT